MFKSSLIFILLNMVSKPLGLVREMLIGSTFGSSGMVDAYVSATKIPNLLLTMFTEGAIGTAFLPIYNKVAIEQGQEKANKFLYSLINLIFIFSLLFTSVLYIFSDPILRILINFSDQERFYIANQLLKITSFNFIFISFVGLLSSVLNNYNKFALSACTGIVMNLSIILGILFFKDNISIYKLGYLYVLSGAMQVIILVPSLMKITKKYLFIFDWKDKNVKELFVTMLPVMIGMFGIQINEIVDNRYATMLPVGTVSSLNYATRLYFLPLSLFAISLSVVIFPTLSKAAIKNDTKLVKNILEQGMNMLTILIIPSMFILISYSEEIVRLLYKRGQFTENSVIMTSEILQMYSLGLLFYSSIQLLARVHYGYKNRKLTIISSFCGIVVNIILDGLLYKEYKHQGLTFATTIAGLVNFMILFLSVRKRYVKINLRKYIMTLILTISVSLVSFYITDSLTKIIKISDIFGKYAIIFIIIIFLILYLVFIMLLYYKEIKKYVCRRTKKSNNS